MPVIGNQEPKSKSIENREMQAPKYYVVWAGHAPGVYDSWEEAELQVKGYPGASFRAFRSETEAVQAFRAGYDKEGLLQAVARRMEQRSREGRALSAADGQPQSAAAPSQSAAAAAAVLAQPAAVPPHPAVARRTPEQERAALAERARRMGFTLDAIAVDAACSGNPGPMEYRGVYLRTGQQLFKVGPLAGGTNNVGEFLAIVHALALQERQGTRLVIYSDSRNAQLWVRQGACKTKLEPTASNRAVFDMIRRAEAWLRAHPRPAVPILKWETKRWGEIPADFGRK